MLSSCAADVFHASYLSVPQTLHHLAAAEAVMQQQQIAQQQQQQHGQSGLILDLCCLEHIAHATHGVNTSTQGNAQSCKPSCIDLLNTA
jgi:hypothetical protein